MAGKKSERSQSSKNVIKTPSKRTSRRKKPTSQDTYNELSDSSIICVDEESELDYSVLLKTPMTRQRTKKINEALAKRKNATRDESVSSSNNYSRSKGFYILT